MNNLKQIQEYNRKAIICAVHNTDDYEEALEKELRHKGCIIETNIGSSIRKDEVIYFDNDFGKNTTTVLMPNNKISFVETTYNKPKIIGKPLTLDRVLLALKEVDYWIEPYGIIINICYQDSDGICKTLFNWNLEKETLEEQTEETQIEIAKLLGGLNDNS
jgi:hypothetical protein